MNILNLIVAVDKNFGIGFHGGIPWCVHSDLRLFKHLTQKSILVFGRKTWESLTDPQRLFSGRYGVIVITKELHNTKPSDFVQYATSVGNALLKSCARLDFLDKEGFDMAESRIYISGGENVYRETMMRYSHLLHSMYISMIPGEFPSDACFPILGIPPDRGNYIILGHQIKRYIEHFVKKPICLHLTRNCPSEMASLLTGGLECFVTGSDKAATEGSSGVHPCVAEPRLMGGVAHLSEATSNQSRVAEAFPLEFFPAPENRFEAKWRGDPCDQPYLDLVKEVLQFGSIKNDRTGVGTLSLFSKTLRFDLTKGFPLMTHKRIPWKAVALETLFFLQGKTDTKELEAKGVNIWKGNTSKAFIEKRGLNYPEGDMGPLYGHQWRRFNAPYSGSKESIDSEGVDPDPKSIDSGSKGVDSGSKGVDQIRAVLKSLKEDPDSRRHVITAWNPAQLQEMVLPPCHGTFQFYVRREKGFLKPFLDCLMFQRSSDLILGEPFNIASYALITHIFAALTGFHPGRLNIHLGDVHIYNNHIQAAYEFLERESLAFPILKLNFDEDKEIDDIQFDDLELIDYNAFPNIKLDMAV